MIDVKTAVRTAYYSLLNGALTSGSNGVQVADTLDQVTDKNNTYVLLISENSIPDNTHQSFMNEELIRVDIIARGSRVPTKTVDDIAGQILALVLPTPQTNGLPAQSKISIINVRVVDDRYQSFRTDGAINVARRMITFGQLTTPGPAVISTPGLSIISTNTTYLMTQYNDILLVDSSVGGGPSILLPFANTLSKIIVVKKTDSSANSVLIYPNAPNLLNGSGGAVSITTQNQYKAFYSDLTNFFTL